MRIHELGHIVFYVTNLEQSANFYKNILGLREIQRDLHTALFSSGRTHHELLLIEIGGTAPKKDYPKVGLYHVGFKIGNTDDELRQAIEELTLHGVTITGAADHHVTHSVYVMDPDNNELELYIDVDESWKENPQKILNPTRRLIL